MKTLSELYSPKPKAEKEFVKKHTDASPPVAKNSKPTQNDGQFVMSNVKTFRRKEHRMGNDTGDDEKAYGVGPKPGPNDQNPAVSIAPYSIKTNEEGETVFEINIGDLSVEEAEEIFADILETNLPANEYKGLKKTKPKESKGEPTRSKASKLLDKFKGKDAVRKEEVEQLDELSPKTLKSYTKKAGGYGRRSGWGLAQKGEKEEDKSMSTDGYKYPEKQERHQKAASKLYHKSNNRDKGVELAKRKLKEELNEDFSQEEMIDVLFELLDEMVDLDVKGHS